MNAVEEIARESPAVAWWTPLAIATSAFLLRLYHVTEVLYRFDFADGPLNVAAARAYVRLGFLGPDHWWTQPLRHLLMYSSIMLFGNDPVGWRMRNVFFGTGVVVVTYYLGRTLFKRKYPATAAAILVALDPLSIAFSRTTFEDVPAIFFILTACLFFIRASKRDRVLDWLVCGVSIGCAAALRWYTIFPGFVMFVVLLARRRGSWKPYSYIVALPLSVYVASYLPWATRGYSFMELIRLNFDAFQIQASGFNDMIGVSALAGPGRWFVSWIGSSAPSMATGGYDTMLNDLPIWLFFLPAVVNLLVKAYRTKALYSLIPSCSFILMYAFFLLSQRPIMLYSALPLVPLGALAVAFGADQYLGKRAWIFLAAAGAWSAYLYPIASGIPVPWWEYGWLLARMRATL